MVQRIKKWVGILTAGVLLLGGVPLEKAAAESSVSVSAASCVVMEAVTGAVLYEKNAREERPMASTTKIMTALLCLESGDLDREFSVDSDAIHVEGSSMGLVEGDRVTKRALCYGMLLPSGNDAAGAAAVELAGSYAAFAQQMNQRAEQLGMTQTHFVTPSGLHDDAHYTTAYDMALLTAAALQNEIFREICSQEKAQVSFGNPPYDRWLSNSNKLLSMDDSIIGVKTGFTDEAGRCLVSAAVRDGVTLICVTLNDPNDWQDHLALYDSCFSMVEPVACAVPENWTVPVAGERKWPPFLSRQKHRLWPVFVAARCRSWNLSWKRRRFSMPRSLPGSRWAPGVRVRKTDTLPQPERCMQPKAFPIKRSSLYRSRNQPGISGCGTCFFLRSA